MADITDLKNRIRAAIKQNDNQEITGIILQTVLLDIVDSLNADDTTAIEALTTALNAETSRAQGAENTLTSSINTETNRAQNAESTLDGKIDTETARAQAAESTLDGKIDAETARAQAAETTLGGNITSETSRAQTAENTLDGKIDTEKGRITSEISRAQTAENTLDGKITTEKNRAQTAENTLDGKITTEKNRAQTAEGDLGNRIGSLDSALGAFEQFVLNNCAFSKNLSEIDEGDEIEDIGRGLFYGSSGNVAETAIISIANETYSQDGLYLVCKVTEPSGQKAYWTFLLEYDSTEQKYKGTCENASISGADLPNYAWVETAFPLAKKDSMQVVNLYGITASTGHNTISQPANKVKFLYGQDVAKSVFADYNGGPYIFITNSSNPGVSAGLYWGFEVDSEICTLYYDHTNVPAEIVNMFEPVPTDSELQEIVREIEL